MELSYVCGTSMVPLLYKTVGVALEEAAQRWADRPALIVRHQNLRWTYRELNQAAERFAAGLIKLGLEPGDRVGIWSPNRYEWVLTQFATAKAGLILVNVNPAYRISELEFALNKVGCKALILAPNFKSSDYVSMLRQVAPELASSAVGDLRAARLPTLRTVILTDDARERGFMPFNSVETLGTAAERERLDELRQLLQPEDPINIQFTSGHGPAQRRDAVPSQHPQQWLLRREPHGVLA